MKLTLSTKHSARTFDHSEIEYFSDARASLSQLRIRQLFAYFGMGQDDVSPFDRMAIRLQYF